MSFTVLNILFSLLSSLLKVFTFTFLTLYIYSLSCSEYSNILNKTIATFTPLWLFLIKLHNFDSWNKEYTHCLICIKLDFSWITYSVKLFTILPYRHRDSPVAIILSLPSTIFSFSLWSVSCKLTRSPSSFNSLPLSSVLYDFLKVLDVFYSSLWLISPFSSNFLLSWIIFLFNS